MLLKLRQIYHFVRLAYGLIRVSSKPEATSYIFDIAESLRGLNAFQETKRILLSDPKSQVVIQRRELVEGYSLQELALLPEGSLGKTYADHMLQNKLNPEFYRRIEVIDDQTYTVLRMRQTHDLWHVVTGFKTNVPGELGLQAFMLAQIAVPLAMILIGGAILQLAFRKQEDLFPVMNSISKGWQMGCEAKSLFNFDWNANWQTSLVSIREELAIKV